MISGTDGGGAGAPLLELRGAGKSFDGVTVLSFEAEVRPPNLSWDGGLYRAAVETPMTSQKTTVKAIPYFAWAYRDAGAMRVWLKRGD